MEIQVQKKDLDGLESACLRRVTGLVSKSYSELSCDMEKLFSISDAYHVVGTLLSLPMSDQMLEQTFKVLYDIT